MNASLAVFFLLLLAPLLTELDGKPRSLQVGLVLFAVPFLLIAVLCLVSAARPGALGRAVRRRRARRARRTTAD